MALSKTMSLIVEAIEVSIPMEANWWQDHKPKNVNLTNQVYRSYLSQLVQKGYLRNVAGQLEYTGKEYTRPGEALAAKGWLNRLQLVANEQAKGFFKVGKTTVQKRLDERTMATVEMAVVTFTSKPMSPEEAEMLIIKVAENLGAFKKKE